MHCITIIHDTTLYKTMQRYTIHFLYYVILYHTVLYHTILHYHSILDNTILYEALLWRGALISVKSLGLSNPSQLTQPLLDKGEGSIPISQIPYM